MPAACYKTPEELRKKVEEYFAVCEEQAIFPDVAGMRLHIGMGESTINKYCNEKHKDFEEYSEIFKWAQDKRESWLVRKMTSDNKAAQGCLNALKQPSNGGYIDRPVQEQSEKTLRVVVVGVGGEEAFK